MKHGSLSQNGFTNTPEFTMDFSHNDLIFWAELYTAEPYFDQGRGLPKENLYVSDK